MLKKVLKIAGLIFIVVIVAGVIFYFKYLRPKPLPISDEDRTAIELMPLPSSLKLKGNQFKLTASLGLEIEGPQDELVNKAASRFTTRLGETTNISFSSGNNIKLIYQTATEVVQPVQCDESYELEINKNSVELKASSGYGVIRGFETLLQLLKKDGDSFYWPTLKLTDAPRYPWRGLMIDVGRHFIPKDVILRNLEAMAAVKMNVLHWHLSDYQGIRVESKVFPKLQQLGSNGKYYSQEDIKEIVSFAHDRGIRVVPEFDLPGHSSGFLVGYPELASAPGPNKLETTFGIFEPVMDPTREEVYTFLDAFIEEMSKLFPDKYFHIGGDEVNYSHWTNNERIQSFMKENGIEDNHALQAYFNQQLEKILNKHSKKMIGWDEILNPNLSNDIVVQCWRSHKSFFQALQKGNKAILSAGYYLDHKLSAAKHYGVDPEVMAGAITIKPDSLNWKEYALELEVSGSKMPTNLVLYGEGSELRGLFYFMENATAFESATIEDNKLNFTFPSDFGNINCRVEFSGDSATGSMSLGLLSFLFSGNKVGSNDMAGTFPPKVEQIKPLSDEDKKNILGGEAAMWTELVSASNIDSRIWPRAAAIAEKWWSPTQLTKDSRDMYRRLDLVSLYLDQLGVQHLKGQKELIINLAEGKDTQPVKTLVSILQEVKLAERFGLGGNSTLDSLNEVVDAAAPESMLAVKFSQMVDDFLADSAHKLNEESIRKLLTTWRDNHVAFKNVAEGNVRLEKVLETSHELSMMSNFGLMALDSRTGKKKLSNQDKEAFEKAIGNVADSRAGVLIAVAPAIKKLIDAMN